MQPEPRERIVPIVPAPEDLPEDRELALLDATLTTAGSSARHADEAPSAAFAAALRERLLAGLPAGEDLLPAGAGLLAATSSVAAPANPERAATPRPVAARTSWQLPSLVPSWRTAAVAMAAVLVVALLGVGALRLVPVAPEASVVAAAGTTLLRDGGGMPLASGAALRSGDEIRVAVDGSATLAIGSGETRLAGGAELRIVALERGRVTLEQLAGRVWHRVAVPDGTSYRVLTGQVGWIALGTAFDLDRQSGAQAGDVVRAIGIEHSVRVEGPDLSAVVDAGREATIVLEPGAAAPDMAIAAVDQTTLEDPWLLANARRDAALGFDPGVLVALEPSPEPSSDASAVPSAPPSAPASPSLVPSTAPSIAPTAPPTPAAPPSATPKPSAKPTPTPSVKPSPTPIPKPSPTPAPAIGSLSLSLAACHGGTVLDWSAWKGDGFDHYTVFRSTGSFAVPKRYPPVAPVVALDGTYTTDPATTSSHDAGLAAGATYFYRALAFDADDRVLASSPLKSAVAKGIKALGTLGATVEGGAVTVDWTSYGGPGSCFSYYKVVWSSSTKTPSYLGDHDGAIPTGEQADASLTIDGFGSGAYWFRVQAIRVTELGKFVVAQTSVAKVLVP